jgi:hypothetical protein
MKQNQYLDTIKEQLYIRYFSFIYRQIEPPRRVNSYKKKLRLTDFNKKFNFSAENRINLPFDRASISAKQRLAFLFSRQVGKFVFNKKYQDSITDDISLLQQEVFPEKFRKIAAPPATESWITFNPDDPLASTALAGPLGIHIKHERDNIFQLDFSYLSKYQTKPDCEPAGGIAWLELNREGNLETKLLEYNGEKYSRSDKGWDNSYKAVSSALGFTQINNHLVQTHLIIGGCFAQALKSSFSGSHPLAKVLFPHMDNTLETNNDQAYSLIGTEKQVLPLNFSFAKKEIEKIIKDKVESFDISEMDLLNSFSSRGFGVSGEQTVLINNSEGEQTVDYPTARNFLILNGVIERHISRVIDRLYPTENDLLADAEVKNFINTLAGFIPNGLWFSASGIEKKEIKKLLTIFIFNVTVFHSASLAPAYDYFGMQNLFPARLKKGFALPPKMEVTRTFFTLLIVSKRKSMPLLGIRDWASDELTASLFESFYEDLVKTEKIMIENSGYFIFPGTTAITIDK